MAYFLGDSFQSKYCGTEIEFVGGSAALQEFFKKTYRYPGTIVKADWRSGVVVPADLVPRTVRIRKGRALYDWRTIYHDGGTLVSSRFKDAVEAIERDRHQFFPVDVLDKVGNPLTDKFFVFNVVGRIDSIIEARSSGISPLGRGLGHDAWAYQRDVSTGTFKLALDASKIAGHACWIEHRYDGRRIVSDRLAALLTDRKLEGFDLDNHCEEVSAG